jgi:hypothetical protein
LGVFVPPPSDSPFLRFTILKRQKQTTPLQNVHH